MLVSKIKIYYPDLKDEDFLNGNIIIQDEGKGAYIKKWDLTDFEKVDFDSLVSDEKAKQYEGKKINKTEGEIYTINGIDYQVPFMKDDADGVMQVNAAFQLGINETVIYFTNGTKMPITDVEFQEFVIWFVTRRNEFFLNKGGN